MTLSSGISDLLSKGASNYRVGYRVDTAATSGVDFGEHIVELIVTAKAETPQMRVELRKIHREPYQQNSLKRPYVP